MRFLITGGGFLGSRVAEALLGGVFGVVLTGLDAVCPVSPETIM